MSQPGQIERDLKLIHLKDEKSYLRGIVKTAAHRADQEKRFSEAVLLYNIAEEYDSVISVLNVELGNSLSRPSSTGTGGSEAEAYFSKGETVSIAAGQEDVAKVARSILEHYDRSSSMGGRVSRKNRETCEVLMRLKEAMTQYEQGRLDQALQVRPSSLRPCRRPLTLSPPRRPLRTSTSFLCTPTSSPSSARPRTSRISTKQLFATSTSSS